MNACIGLDFWILGPGGAESIFFTPFEETVGPFLDMIVVFAEKNAFVILVFQVKSRF